MSANHAKHLILQGFYSLVSIIFWLVAYFAHRTLDEKSDFGQKNAHFSSTFCMKKVGTLLDTSQSVVRFLLGAIIDGGPFSDESGPFLILSRRCFKTIKDNKDIKEL